MSKRMRWIFAMAIGGILAAGSLSVYTDAHAACRMRPQCSVNADCDAICGVGQGKCVHSSCPIRICKCS